MKCKREYVLLGVTHTAAFDEKLQEEKARGVSLAVKEARKKKI
jgi:hypothetical protein